MDKSRRKFLKASVLAGAAVASSKLVESKELGNATADQTLPSTPLSDDFGLAPVKTEGHTVEYDSMNSKSYTRVHPIHPFDKDKIDPGTIVCIDKHDLHLEHIVAADPREIDSPLGVVEDVSKNKEFALVRLWCSLSDGVAKSEMFKDLNQKLHSGVEAIFDREYKDYV